jgi:hypothetical protein
LINYFKSSIAAASFYLQMIELFGLGYYISNGEIDDGEIDE